MKQDKMISFDNVAIMDDPGPGNLQSGQIAFANTSRFEAANYNEALTGYLVSYEDPEDLWGLLEKIIPSVMVTRRFNFKKNDKASAFLTEMDDIRAAGQRHFKRVEFLGDEVNARTANKGLTTFIDEEELELPMIEQVRTGMLVQRLARNEINRFAGAGGLLDIASTNLGVNWSPGINAKADPDNDMLAMLDAAQQSDGIWKNQIVMGKSAWVTRKQSYRTQLTAGSLASANMTEQEVADFLGIKKIVVSDKVKQVTKATKTRLIGSVLYAYYVVPGISKDDPSDFKRFVSPARGGGQFGVFRKELSTGIEITVQHYSVLTSTSGLSTPKRTVS